MNPILALAMLCSLGGSAWDTALHTLDAELARHPGTGAVVMLTRKDARTVEVRVQGRSVALTRATFTALAGTRGTDVLSLEQHEPATALEAPALVPEDAGEMSVDLFGRGSFEARFRMRVPKVGEGPETAVVHTDAETSAGPAGSSR